MRRLYGFVFAVVASILMISSATVIHVAGQREEAKNHKITVFRGLVEKIARALSPMNTYRGNPSVTPIIPDAPPLLVILLLLYWLFVFFLQLRK